MKPRYSTPKLIKFDDLKKTWYVYFRFDGKIIKRTHEINRIINRKERIAAGEALAKVYLEKLQEGWNPLISDTTTTEGVTFNLYTSLAFALEKKKPNITSKTYSAYNGTVKFCKLAIEELKYNNLLITETARKHVKMVLETASKQRNWSKKAYNKHLGHMHALFKELIQWDVIEANPADNITRMAVPRTQANIPPTASQLEKIKHCLSSKHPDFYFFVAMIFHTGIRPVELTRIKLEMINWQRKEIYLPAEITKTDIDRYVPINSHLVKFFEPIMSVNNPKEYYLFGSFRPSAKGNIGSHRDFIPAPTQMKRDTATKRWERIVKIGLGIDVNLYAMKKAGANAKIMAGMSTRSLKELFGHTSEVTTEIYITNVQEFVRREILEKSPAF